MSATRSYVSEDFCPAFALSAASAAASWATSLAACWRALWLPACCLALAALWVSIAALSSASLISSTQYMVCRLLVSSRERFSASGPVSPQQATSTTSISSASCQLFVTSATCSFIASRLLFRHRYPFRPNHHHRPL